MFYAIAGFVCACWIARCTFVAWQDMTQANARTRRRLRELLDRNNR